MKWQIFLFFLGLLCSCSKPKNFSASTEEELSNPDPIPKEIVKLILADNADDKKGFQECLSESGLKKSESNKLFLAKKIDLNDDGISEYFVRPALTPYCQVFYGAHLFRYWLIEKQGSSYKFLLKSGGDIISINSEVTNGYYDISESSHTAMENYTTVSKFQTGHGYKPYGCTVEHYKDGKVVSTESCETQ